MCRRNLCKYIPRQMRRVEDYKIIVKFLTTDLGLDKIKKLELTF
jgi:hypothetical protein